MHRIDGYDEFLADEIGDQVLLGRVDMAGEPKDPDLFQEGEDDLGDGPLHALSGNESIEGFLDTGQVEVDHSLNQVVDHPLLLSLCISKRIDPIADLIFRHAVDMRNLESVLIQQGNVQQRLQLIIGIITDVSLRTLGL